MLKSNSWIYHYTNGSSLRQIVRSKTLKTSKGGNGDIKLGEGVYMTKLFPDENSDEQLFYNNYGAATLEGKSHDDVQYYVKMASSDIARDRLICRFKENRDIYVWSDNDIDLSKIRFSVGRRKGGNIDWEIRDDNMDILAIDDNKDVPENDQLDLMAKYENCKSELQELANRLDLKITELHVQSTELMQLKKKTSVGPNGYPARSGAHQPFASPVTRLLPKTVPDILVGDGRGESNRIDDGLNATVPKGHGRYRSTKRDDGRTYYVPENWSGEPRAKPKLSLTLAS